MNRRSRSSHRSEPNRSEPFLKYLKPGALAQIRDSRISSSSRSHRINWISQIRSTPPMSPSSNSAASVAALTVAADGFPCFAGRIFGPRCPQRKKLVAGKSVMFLRPPSPAVADSPDPIIDLFSSDILAAH